MKIAIGTDDKKTIRKGHFGESRYYLVIEILNAQIVGEESREKPYLESGKAKKDTANPKKSLVCFMIAAFLWQEAWVKNPSQRFRLAKLTVFSQILMILTGQCHYILTENLRGINIMIRMKKISFYAPRENIPQRCIKFEFKTV